ncbi:MAG: KpsF/GutQ family sugar-phosphate isomerase [Tepidisphaera sp.]
MPADSHLEAEFARAVLRTQADALSALGRTLPGGFLKAVDLIVHCADSGGTVLVSGLGKSGLVGAKISATLSSLGIPSHPVHPTEAVHGDLGRFRPTDTVICISNSGETDEVVALAGILRQDGIPIISITKGDIGSDIASEHGKPSSLERVATVALRFGNVEEAGGEFGVGAPTTSTTATLALGDALAMTAARRRGFTSADFARRHPGGSLGGLLRPVRELLRFVVGKNLPIVPDHLSVDAALRQAAAVLRRPGALLLVDRDGKLSGILTDGDLRRIILRDRGELDRPAKDLMTRSPRTLAEDSLVRDAVNMVREHRQDEIPVVDAQGKPVGILDVQDLIAMRLVQE